MCQSILPGPHQRRADQAGTRAPMSKGLSFPNIASWLTFLTHLACRLRYAPHLMINQMEGLRFSSALFARDDAARRVLPCCVSSLIVYHAVGPGPLSRGLRGSRLRLGQGKI